MARCIMENGRRDILVYLSNCTFRKVNGGGKKYASKYPRVFKRALSVEHFRRASGVL